MIVFMFTLGAAVASCVLIILFGPHDTQTCPECLASSEKERI